MKKVIFFLTLIVTAATAPEATAQRVFNFEYVTMGSGESVVADGMYFTATASHGNNLLTAAFTPISAEARYLSSDVFGINGLYLGPSGGFMKGVPWFGPIATYSPISAISLTAWTGVSAGDAALGVFDLKNPEMAFLQLDAMINFTENLYVGFSYLEFSGDHYLPYAGGEMSLGSAMAIFGSITLPVKDGKFDDPMFFLGFRLGFN
ncbi:MAG: hypothetical protein WD335_01970 [Candidatus Paceibacterota bacterium]